jgi:hypothetical protein
MRAAHVAAWGWQWPSSVAGPMSAASVGSGIPTITFPTTPLSIKVELFLGGAWVDISDYVLYTQKIKITRGRSDEAQRAQPSKCSLRLKNPNKLWSPRNPNGAYYGLLKKRNRLRVTVNPGDNDHIRFTGRIPNWPQKWTTGDHRWVDITAFGELYRLESGKSPLKSPLTRVYSTIQKPVYMALEDAADSTEVLGSPNNGVITGEPTFRPSTGPIWGSVGGIDLSSGASVHLPIDWNLSTAGGVEFSPFSTTGWGVEFSGSYRDSTPGSPNVIVTVGSTVGVYYQIILSDALWDGEPHHVYAWIYPNGGTNQVDVYRDGVFSSSSSVGGTGNIGKPRDLWLNIDQNTGAGVPNITHVALTTEFMDPADRARAARAYVGELATDRFARLCAEEGIDYEIDELIVETEGMGKQTIASLNDLLRACEATNEGFIDETFEGRLRLNSRTRQYNQLTTMIIDYVADDLSEEFDPVDDDSQTINDWTITPEGGTAVQYQKTSGTLNINDPDDDPNGAGIFDSSTTLSLATQDQAIQHASYRVAQGTIDEMRFPVVPLHFTRNPNLLPDWLKMDNGRRFEIHNCPEDIGGGTVRQNMTGYTESLDQFEWTTDIGGMPDDLDYIGILDVYGFLDCGACTLNEELDTTETSIDTRILDACWWAVDHGPVPLIINGEEMLLTAVAAPVGLPSNWTQTLTVVRSVNGIVRTHAIGSEVHTSEPIILAL